MSNSSALNDAIPAGDAGEGTNRPLQHLRASLQFVGFWSAIALPFVYVPYLLTGLSGALDTAVLVGLVLLNAVALYVGHGYDP